MVKIATATYRYLSVFKKLYSKHTIAIQIVFVSVLIANTLYPPPSCFLVLNVEKFRVRYRYGFPAGEETRLRGRDTGQTRRAYSSFFSA